MTGVSVAETLVALTAFIFAAVGVYAFARRQVHDPEKRTEPSPVLLVSRRRDSDTERELLDHVARVSFMTGQRPSVVLANLNDSVAAGPSSPAATAPPSRGVDRVPDRLKVVRTIPLPDPIRATRDVGGRWVGLSYRNPDRLARLAKNGRLRADLMPEAGPD